MPAARRRSFFRSPAQRKSARGQGAKKTWDELMLVYGSLIEQYNGASEEEKQDIKAAFNECVDEFGEELFASEADANLAWSDLIPEDRERIAAIIEDNLLDPESGEGE